jgi:hypothetical protein
MHMALTRCRKKSARGLDDAQYQVAAIASRNVLIAADRKALCVSLVERWRWTLKVL